ncbi:hypothetical protein K1X76_05200 [bacterium]|nr:hypothetical protein [bacterium]
MDGITKAASSFQSPSASATDSKSSIFGANKDDFLKLFLAQLQHQDPMNAQDPNQMMQQMTQFGQLEQLMNLNTSFSSLNGLNQSMQSTQAVNFIGKNVSAYGNTIGIKGTEHGKIAYDLARAADEVVAEVYNAAGQKVRTISFENQPGGVSSHEFDGLNDKGQVLPDGNYRIKVTGKNADGTLVTALPLAIGTVSSLEFTQSGPILNVGGNKIAYGDIISVEQ